MPLPPGQDPAGDVSQTVGAQLRRARVLRDESIGAIADYLRIKPEYLFAFEQERHDQLPPLTYTLGFVHSYAIYLGLDGLALREAYRQEMLDKLTPQLAMPQPLTEAHSPPWPIILGALLAALLIYSLWQQLDRPDAVPVPPPEPPRLSSTYQPARAKPAPSPSVVKPAAPPILAPLVLRAIEPLAVSRPTPPPKPVPIIQAAPAPQPAPVAPTPSTPSAPSTLATTQSEIPVPVAAPDGRRHGDTSRPTRRVIHTAATARVTIRNAQQRLIFSRMLQPGDTYQVPDRSGLRLSSSRPDALTIVQDGKNALQPGAPDTETFGLTQGQPGEENP